MLTTTYFQAQKMAHFYGLRPGRPTRLALDAFIRGRELSVEDLRRLVVGSGRRVMVHNPTTGLPVGLVPHIRMNYGATKPSFVPVLDTTHQLEISRENVGRSAGPDAETMSAALEEARDVVGKFVGYDASRHVAIFVENTTAAMNLLARIAIVKNPGLNFVVSLMSHHSTQLPARQSGHFKFFKLKPDGSYDLDSLEQELKTASRLGGGIALCVESESNVTGIKNSIPEICQIAARYDALVFIDHAQGGSNIPLNLSQLHGRVFVAVSGHKLYGPTGSGAVIGPKIFFRGPALRAGGGTISAVTATGIHYAEPPANCESGTPAFIAQIGFAKALKLLMETGLDNIAQREDQLLSSFWPQLLSVNGLEVLGCRELNAYPRGPVVSFRLKDSTGKEFIPPGFIGYALQAFYGVDCRVGQFCAHPYVYALLGVSEENAIEHALVHARIAKAGCAALPGDQNFHTTRFSWAFPTEERELAVLPDMLRAIQGLWPNKSILELDQARRAFHIPSQPDNLTEGSFSLQRRTPYSLL